jgi:aclacinomycin oxidase
LLEGFVSDPPPRVIIDVSPMKRIYLTPSAGDCGGGGSDGRRGVSRAARQLGRRRAARRVSEIGMGGHVAGGAFGFLCRQLGLAADYLHAVEVVVVDEQGRARAVVGTRDASDPYHDLWWAHTGAGGGNFGS